MNSFKEKSIEQAVLEEIKLFRHSFSGNVRFDEVDSFGVVHNIKYLYWMEWARIDYLQTLGIKLNPLTFLTELPLLVVHTDIDYFNPARFNDEYKVLSRISLIKKSSLCFENIILHNTTLLAKAKSFLVHLDAKQRTPSRIPDLLRNLINVYENNNVQVIE